MLGAKCLLYESLLFILDCTLLLKNDFEWSVDKFLTLEFLIKITFFSFVTSFFGRDYCFCFNGILVELLGVNPVLTVKGFFAEELGLNSFFKLLDWLLVECPLNILLGVQRLDLLSHLKSEGTLITLTTLTCLFYGRIRLLTFNNKI